jgi:hypothetical protein
LLRKASRLCATIHCSPTSKYALRRGAGLQAEDSAGQNHCIVCYQEDKLSPAMTKQPSPPQSLILSPPPRIWLLFPHQAQLTQSQSRSRRPCLCSARPAIPCNHHFLSISPQPELTSDIRAAPTVFLPPNPSVIMVFITLEMANAHSPAPGCAPSIPKQVASRVEARKKALDLGGCGS